MDIWTKHHCIFWELHTERLQKPNPNHIWPTEDQTLFHTLPSCKPNVLPAFEGYIENTLHTIFSGLKYTLQSAAESFYFYNKTGLAAKS